MRLHGGWWLIESLSLLIHRDRCFFVFEPGNGM
jgi:hypothetical protein